MDKNTLIGFSLIGAVLIGFSIYNRPSAEQLEMVKRQQDSIAAVEAKQATIAKQQAEKAKVEATQKMLTDSTSLFYTAAKQTTQPVVLKNNLVEITIDNKGGRVSKVVLADYKDQQHKPLVLFEGEDASLNFTFDGKNENLRTSELYFTPTAVTNESVTMRLPAANGGYLDFNYRLLPNSYSLDLTIQAVGLQNYFAASTNSMQIDWYQRARQLEKGFTFEQRYTALTFKPSGESFDDLSETKDEQLKAEKPLEWVAFKNQYFSAVFMAERNFEQASLQSKVEQQGSGYLKDYTAQLRTFFDPTGKKASKFQYYLGPNHFKTLIEANDLSFKDKDQELEDLVYLGWPIIRWVNRYFTVNLFDWLSGLGLSMGIVILLMTIIVKVIVIPTTWKTMLSSAKMRALRPYIQKINEKYTKPEDALKKQQETMALYSQYRVNPMGGCLPQLIQMPIFMALFFFVPNAIELRQQSFLWAKDLSSYDDLIQWNFNIPFLGNHLSLFCLLFSVTTIISQIMTMKQQDNGSNPQMAAMKWMMYLMPIMMFFIFNDYASGLSYYYFVSSLLSILIMWIMHRMIDEKKLLAQLEANKKDISEQKQGGLFAKMAALQKAQEELNKQQKKK